LPAEVSFILPIPPGDDASENTEDGLAGKRAFVSSQNRIQDLFLANRIIDGEIFLLLKFSDGEGTTGANIENLHQLEIEGIDALSPIL
jgi:hypothetical protein